MQMLTNWTVDSKESAISTDSEVNLHQRRMCIIVLGMIKGTYPLIVCVPYASQTDGLFSSMSDFENVI